MAFVHLHNHTEYSLLDGACRIKDIVQKAKELNQEAVAITDHGVMYGVIDFYKECKKNNIKPIIGCEVYVAENSRFEKLDIKNKKNRHLVLLCKNMTGYRNLTALVSHAWTEGFYYKPRIDEELLSQYSEGLIALSACLAGEIPTQILNNNLQKAKEKALLYKSIFGDDFYIELQNHGIKEELMVNSSLVQLANELNIPMVVTNDCHYINKEDSKIHEVLLCIQTGHTINDEDKFEFPTNEFYFKSEEEMRELFPKINSAYENTVKIAQKCNLEFDFGNTKLPYFEVPNNMNHFEYFKNKCYEGLYKLYDAVNEKLINRLEYELKIINQMGFVDYFLIVADFVNYAKNNDIPVGPGRGSGAGSLAAYCIGITGIDPIKYNLIFERFLNPERVSMPDFDIDFCKDKRQKVIDYVIEKYGEDHVTQIIAFGTLAARAAVKDVGRALNIPYKTVDNVAKFVPQIIGMTIDKALAISTDLKNLYRTDEKIKQLIDIARKIEGMPRHTTTHAAGVVITDEPVINYVPLSKNDDVVVTQFEKGNLEELGLLKMDFLGLRNLTILDNLYKIIQSRDKSFSRKSINYEDADVYKMMSKGFTEGVFQFESSGMKGVLKQFKPKSIEDLTALTSLYRPGPMDSIPKYIENRHNPKNIEYLHPLLKDILDVTYGCIVYQEQVMQIFRTLAGYSLGRADIVRRAMAKKKHSVMEQEKEIFINGLRDSDGNLVVDGCVNRGVKKETALQIFSEMESFASYAFNKSHAVCYATIAFETAWFKCKYPKEFMIALLSSVLDNTGKLVRYINEAKRMNIKILPPSINKSRIDFSIEGDDIRFGLLAIKNVGSSLLKEIIDERKNGEYLGLYDFCRRIAGKGLNSKALESLIMAGAFDNLSLNRRQMLISCKEILQNTESEYRQKNENQISFFDDESINKSFAPIIPELEEYPENEKISMEKEVLGICVSSQPLSSYKNYIESKKFDKIGDIQGEDSIYSDGKSVRLFGIINSVRTKNTAQNKLIAFLNLEDDTGNIDLLCFSKMYAENKERLKEGSIVEIVGNISEEDGKVKIISNYVGVPPQNIMEFNDIPNRIYLRFESKDDIRIMKSTKILSEKGNVFLSYYFNDTKTYYHFPNDNRVFFDKKIENELKDLLGENNVVLK